MLGINYNVYEKYYKQQALDGFFLIEFPRISSWSEVLLTPSLLFKAKDSLLENVSRTVNHAFTGQQVNMAFENSLDKFAHNNTCLSLLSSVFQDYQQGTFHVGTLLSHATYLCAVGMIFRLLNISTISIQNNFYRKNWSAQAKILASTSIGILPFFIMDTLGYSSQQIAIAEIIRTCSVYLLPYMLGNWLKELDIISPTKNFSQVNYLAITGKHYFRNLCSSILHDQVWHYIGTTRELAQYEKLSSDLAKKDVAGVFIGSLSRIVMTPASNSTVFIPKLFTDEVGFILGKIFIDLSIVLLAKFGVIADIRDPFNFLFRKNEVQKKKSISLPAKILESIIEAQAEQNKESKQLNTSRSTNNSKNQRVAEADTSYEAHYFAPEQSAVKRGKKVFSQVENENKAEPIKNLQKDLRKAFSNCALPSHKIAPLHGTILQGNIWGVITTNDCGNNFDRLERSLETGVIGQSSNIKYLGKGGKTSQYIFEIKCSKDARLLGYYTQEEQGIYDGLKNTFGMDNAQSIIDKARGESETLGFICFSTYVAKHEDITKTLQRM